MGESRKKAAKTTGKAKKTAVKATRGSKQDKREEDDKRAAGQEEAQ
ncbi:hypothetical protein [Sphaerisporangium sp. TRM90804]|nr:hypothetical protein [Sphaerisporangium sp. TRM90804]MDH2426192.1 hypothetical protein [Sphaerisporangium sp. TRM90804]